MRTGTGENPIYLDSPGSGSGSTLEFPVLSVCLGFIKPLSVWFSALSVEVGENTETF